MAAGSSANPPPFFQNERRFSQNERRFFQNERRFFQNERRFFKNERRFFKNPARLAQKSPSTSKNNLKYAPKVWPFQHFGVPLQAKANGSLEKTVKTVNP
jgi:hypothetical protein